MLTNAPTKVEQLYKDILEAARIVEVPCNEPVVERVLQTYQHFFENAGVSLRTTTHPPEKRDLSLRYVAAAIPHDPYPLTLEGGLYTETGHPVEAVLPELREHFGRMHYGVDTTVRYGFQKIWAMLEDAASAQELLSLKTLPDSARRYVPTLSRFGLELVDFLAMDFRAKTLNVCYFIHSPGNYPPERVAAMIVDAGFKVPVQEELEISSKTICIYYTFSWDTPVVERISFGMVAPQEALPTYIHPLFKLAAEQMPIRGPFRRFTYCTAYSTSGDYLKVEPDYNAKMGDQLMFLFNQKRP